jgi:hypothetical protein
MRTIWKYPIDSTPCHEIEMPLNAEILCVQLQNNIPTLWALVETEEPKRIFDILTYYTGDDTDDALIDKKGQYIGTYQLAGLVHHVFVRPHPASPRLNLSYIC